VIARCTAIVPAYRAAETLSDTLAALLREGHDVVERVIVVASPGDDGAHVARRFRGVEVVESPDRLSAGAARNLGRRTAVDAALLLFLDADCRVESGSVARMIATLERESLAAVGATIARDGGGAVAWVRHAVEFKEADRGAGEGRWPWMLPSAALLCRVEAFDRVGGFPDMWPGEDLVFCHRLRAAGMRVARCAESVVRHRHPRGVRRMLTHQYRLGATSARARAMTRMHGVGFVERPWLAPALLVGRAARGLAWFARNRRGELPVLIALSPLYLLALGAWTVGFTGAARTRAGMLR
jgi:GT2 family glycosyltransferase